MTRTGIDDQNNDDIIDEPQDLKTYLRKILRIMMAITMKLFIFPVYYNKKPILAFLKKAYFFYFFLKSKYWPF